MDLTVWQIWCHSSRMIFRFNKSGETVKCCVGSLYEWSSSQIWLLKIHNTYIYIYMYKKEITFILTYHLTPLEQPLTITVYNRKYWFAWENISEKPELMIAEAAQGSKTVVCVMTWPDLLHCLVQGTCTWHPSACVKSMLHSPPNNLTTV